MKRQSQTLPFIIESKYRADDTGINGINLVVNLKMAIVMLIGSAVCLF